MNVILYWLSRQVIWIAVICLIAPQRLDQLLETLFPLLTDHIGVVSVTDTQILRAERF